jgi:hypothetical protein
MFEYSICNIDAIAAHKIGNKTNGGDIILSQEEVRIGSDRLMELLRRYFLSHFKSPEFFAFTFSNGELEMNPVYSFVSRMFNSSEMFLKYSQDLARHLFECSIHPNIKDGDFYVVQFSNLLVNGEPHNAIGLFKSEVKHPFLKLNMEMGASHIDFDEGINIDKLDKACIILDAEEETGYQVCIIDKTNSSQDTHFWRDQFLNVRPRSDDFHHTKNYLDYTKTFVTDQLKEEFELTKADQIDILNKSIDYFKKNDHFDAQEFSENVFEDNNMIESFQQFGNEYQREREIEIPDNFAVSSPAVKKQSRVFKSVLKLDKNFHIYIHGNKELIERGTDSNGRKYYKIYYSEEF